MARGSLFTVARTCGMSIELSVAAPRLIDYGCGDSQLVNLMTRHRGGH